jgi:hypothetical protein
MSDDLPFAPIAGWLYLMAEIYSVAELADADGNGIGKYRYVRWSDEDPNQLKYPLCCHKHETRAEARNCSEARQELPPELLVCPCETNVDRARHMAAYLPRTKDNWPVVPGTMVWLPAPENPQKCRSLTVHCQVTGVRWWAAEVGGAEGSESFSITDTYFDRHVAIREAAASDE